MSGVRALLLRILRVPPEPAAPPGETDVRVFRAARNYYLYRLIGWGATQIGALVGLLFGLFFLRSLPDVVPSAIRLGAITASRGAMLQLLTFVEVAAWVGYLLQAAGRFALLRLDFEQRWYLVAGRSLRIREGLLRMQEKTMTFANIQNLSIRQGPVQRLLGIYDLEVRSAGGGSGESSEDGPGKGTHTAYFRGITDPAGIRETIRSRLRRHADSGLGDPDEAHGEAAGETTSPVAAARDVLDEARALRSALAARVTTAG